MFQLCFSEGNFLSNSGIQFESILLVKSNTFSYRGWALKILCLRLNVSLVAEKKWSCSYSDWLEVTILDNRKAPPSHQLRGLPLETSMCLERQESCFIKGQVSWLLHLRNKKQSNILIFGNLIQVTFYKSETCTGQDLYQR